MRVLHKKGNIHERKKEIELGDKDVHRFWLGIVIGLVFGEKATIVKPLGTIFLNMIKMIVVPMVFFSITAGVASLGDLKKLRNIGVKVVGLYALTSALCVGLGLSWQTSSIQEKDLI